MHTSNMHQSDRKDSITDMFSDGTVVFIDHYTILPMHVQTWLSLSFVPLALFLSFLEAVPFLIKQSENTYLSRALLFKFHWYPP